MKKEGTRLVAIVAVVSLGLAGCTMVPTDQPVSVAPAYQTEGSVVPVYNPPPNTPFHCVGTPVAISLFGVPSDPFAYPRPAITTGPVATMGNRRGDWLLVVTHSGEIGWLDDPHEQTYEQVNPGGWCHVRQDAEGRIVFNYNVAASIWHPESEGALR
jgi:hypothetical protein